MALHRFECVRVRFFRLSYGFWPIRHTPYRPYGAQGQDGYQLPKKGLQKLTGPTHDDGEGLGRCR